MNLVLRRIFKILGWILGVIVILLAGVSLYVYSVWDKPVQRQIIPLTAPKDSLTIARGEYLYKYSFQCWQCHSEKEHNDNALPAGGKSFDLRDVGPGFGLFYTPNITPDVETGIGKWSDGELVRLLREGIDRNGRVLFPFMPFDWLNGLADSDALSIVAYLKSRPPVQHKIPQQSPSFVTKALFAFNILKPKPQVLKPIIAPSKGPTAAYGKYLATNGALCSDCHNPRNLKTTEFYMDSMFAGSSFRYGENEKKPAQVYARNISFDKETGIGNWTEEDFIKVLRTGTRPDGTVLVNEMPYAFYGLWDEDDMRAIYRYLATVPPVKRKVLSPYFSSEILNEKGSVRGRALFQSYCSECHGENGAGAAPTKLILADLAQTVDDKTLKEFISGGQLSLRMPSFSKTLNGEQIDDVIAFIRTLKH